ncbi:hypothetical protein [Halobacterium sp. KA-6]|uniref:hypothetical protein n=1 Tax=Halobacterium sp. KA-6 TaxID=2896368 RepID=UPI001E5D901B|nr:hypothetical protein [Halobacterium sp. KA-6]MCD2204901.1 hypothetical protein [Halobacterium sp. KA-6]
MPPDRSRRAILASLGSVLLAGCSGIPPTETPTPDTPTSTTPVPSSSTPCSGSGDVTLTAEGEVFTVDERYDGFEFTLRNQTTASLTITRTKAWEIERRTAVGWEQVATEGGVADGETRTLDCGEEHAWHLALFEHPTPPGRKTTYLFVNLAEGRYEFSVTGTLETGVEITRSTQFEVRRQLPPQTETED